MKNYTTKDIAEIKGCNEQTARRACHDLNIKKFGTGYIIEDRKTLIKVLNYISRPGHKKSIKCTTK